LFTDEEITLEAGKTADLICLATGESGVTIELMSTIAQGEICYGELSH
jgi:hypothetical protein